MIFELYRGDKPLLAQLKKSIISKRNQCEYLIGIIILNY